MEKSVYAMSSTVQDHIQGVDQAVKRRMAVAERRITDSEHRVTKLEKEVAELRTPPGIVQSEVLLLVHWRLVVLTELPTP